MKAAMEQARNVKAQLDKEFGSASWYVESRIGIGDAGLTVFVYSRKAFKNEERVIPDYIGDVPVRTVQHRS
jgi:hypothetical protein